MRILIAVSKLSETGGMEKLIFKVYSFLKKKGYDVNVLTGYYSHNKNYKFNPQDIINLNIKHKNLIIYQLSLLKKLKKLKLNFDIINVYDFPVTFLASKYKNVIWYCNTPPRLYYDLNKKYVSKLPIYLRFPAIIFTYIVKKFDKKNVSKIKKIIVNSKNVQKRVKKYYNIDSKIIHPGTDIIYMPEIKYEKFILSVSRLYPEKRVDAAIKQMIKLPDYKLVIVGTGPELDKLKAIKIKYKLNNIFFKGVVSEEKLRELYRDCFCAIYLPEEEDFGLIPIEANSYGKLVLGVEEGGLKETIINKKTGYYINIKDKSGVYDCIKEIEKNSPQYYKNYCLKNANKFSWNNFLKKLDLEFK